MRNNNCSLTFAAFRGLLVCVSSARCLGQGAPAIVIDAATTVAESDSGDDLGTLRNIFQSANAPADGLIEPMRQIMADLKMKRMRLLLSDVYCDVDANGSFGAVSIDANGNLGAFVPGECYPLAWQIQWALDNGLRFTSQLQPLCR